MAWATGGKTHPPMSDLDMTLNTDGEAPVMLELSEMWSTPLLLSLPGLLWPGVVAPDRVLSVGQIELNCTVSNRIVLHLTVCKQNKKTVLTLN